jgi:hypothetical protein
MASKRDIIATNPPQGVWPFTAPDVIYEPLAIIFVTAIAFGVGIGLNEPWVCVPLAATIATAAQSPGSQASAFSQVVLGNLIAILVSYVIVDALEMHHHGITAHAAQRSPLMALEILAGIALTPMVASIFRVVQPAAVATAAFIIFGGIAATTHAALALTADTLVVAALGEFMRRLRVRGAPQD